MDSLLSKVFPTLTSPGMEVKNKDGCYNTIIRGDMQVKVDGFPSSRAMSMAQTMTWLGKTVGRLTGGPSDLDGINKLFLTPEATVNMDAIASHLKSHGGLQNNVLSAHIATMERWNWHDNQVSLLVNMLRYSLLKRLEEANVGEGLNGVLPAYDDGHVRVDRNQFFGATYPREVTTLGWPCGRNDEDIPSFFHGNDYVPQSGGHYLDLSALSEKESRFVLLMLGRWKRTTRYMLDFNLPKLTDAVAYRRHAQVGGLIEFIGDGPDVDPMPPTLTATESWRTLLAYVAHNGLYGAMSTAMHVIANMMCQFVPATAEGHVWLDEELTAVLPRFEAVRGRYVFFNEGEKAYVSHRALSEWKMLNAKQERLFLIGNIMCQAYQTGLALRALRYNVEEQPTDLFATESLFLNPQYYLSAAAAEALKHPVPLAGMSGVGFSHTNRLDQVTRNRRVYVTAANEEARAEYNLHFDNVLEYIEVSKTPFAGVPTLLLPLNPLKDITPFTLRGSIDASKLERNRLGWKATPYELWHWAWASRLCGYDIKIKTPMALENCTRPYAPNESSWTWPLMVKEDYLGERITIVGMEPRQHRFITLPPIHAQFFTGKVDFNFSIMSQMVSLPGRQQADMICEYGATGGLTSAATVRIIVPEHLKQLRGFIDRVEADFRFVERVQAGVIPPEVNMNDAIDAGDG
uniref:Putative capsid protein n=1 Tax=Puccinia striiformis totivirus 5 TaxID=2045193 RepID=A0A2D1PCW5_9VIRU|nr:putative capsid protein [Puccinia striiformis totivirus 5]